MNYRNYIFEVYFLRLRETHNALQLPVFFFSFFSWLCQRYPNIAKFGAKNYFTDHRTQYTVLEIHFRSLKYTSVIRLCNNLSNFSFLSKRYEARTKCWCIQPTPNSFQTLQTVCTGSNCIRNQLSYCWQMF